MKELHIHRLDGNRFAKLFTQYRSIVLIWIVTLFGISFTIKETKKVQIVSPVTDLEEGPGSPPHPPSPPPPLHLLPLILDKELNKSWWQEEEKPAGQKNNPLPLAQSLDPQLVPQELAYFPSVS